MLLIIVVDNVMLWAIFRLLNFDLFLLLSHLHFLYALRQHCVNNFITNINALELPVPFCSMIFIVFFYAFVAFCKCCCLMLFSISTQHATIDLQFIWSLYTLAANTYILFNLQCFSLFWLAHLRWCWCLCFSLSTKTIITAHRAHQQTVNKHLNTFSSCKEIKNTFGQYVQIRNVFAVLVACEWANNTQTQNTHQPNVWCLQRAIRMMIYCAPSLFIKQFFFFASFVCVRRFFGFFPTFFKPFAIRILKTWMLWV